MNLKLNLKNILCFCCLFLSFTLQAQPSLQLEWMHKDPIGIGYHIRKDSQRNVIACGSHSSNITGNYTNLYLTKYDSLGNVLWTISKGDNVGGLFFPIDMALDSADNIYVAGKAHADPMDKEGFLIKYDVQGNFLWLRYFGFTQGLSGFFNSITIYDNKYITVGATMDSVGATHPRSLIAQYSSSGNLNWYRLDNNNFLTRSHSIISDRHGNVYSANATNCCPPSTKASIAKYDTLGNEIWQYPIADSTYHFMWPQKIAIDDSSFIYLVTQAVGSGTGSGYDCGIAKFDSIGNQKWFSIYRDFPYQGKDELPTDILFDKNYCYIYGMIERNLESDGFISKVSKMGNIEWGYIYSPTGHGDDGIVYADFLNDSMIAIAGTGVFMNNTWGSFLQILDTSGYLKMNFSNSDYCVVYDACYIDSTFYLIGNYRDTNEIEPDSSMICKIGFTQLNSILESKPNSEFFPYPNPFDDYIRIATPKEFIAPSETTIYSIQGKPLIKSKGNEYVYTFELSPGAYIFEVFTKDKIARFKIFK